MINYSDEVEEFSPCSGEWMSFFLQRTLVPTASSLVPAPAPCLPAGVQLQSYSRKALTKY